MKYLFTQDKQSGFSLVELMVAVGLFGGIVMAYSIMQSQIYRMQLEAQADNEAMIMLKRIESRVDRLVDSTYFSDVPSGVYAGNYPRGMKLQSFDGASWPECVPQSGVDCADKPNAHFLTRSSSHGVVLIGLGTFCVNNASTNKFAVDQSRIAMLGANCDQPCGTGTHPEIMEHYQNNFDGSSIVDWTVAISFPGFAKVNQSTTAGAQQYKGGLSMPIAAGICFDVYSNRQMTVRFQVETYGGGNWRGEGLRTKVVARTKTYYLDRGTNGDVTYSK